MITVKFLYGKFFRLLDKIDSYAEKSNDKSAKILISDIKRKSKSGKDADNETFTSWTPFGPYKGKGPYSPTQERRRKKAGVTTTRKTLLVRKDGMLASLALRGNVVSVSQEYEEIAKGQHSHPKWRYHHKFLLAGNDTVKKIEETHAQKIQNI